MLRPSVSLAVRLQMYVEARTGATPDIEISDGEPRTLASCTVHVLWLWCRTRHQRKSLNKRELS
eukprot:3559552-Prymnesium_polylepis.2